MLQLDRSKPILKICSRPYHKISTLTKKSVSYLGNCGVVRNIKSSNTVAQRKKNRTTFRLQRWISRSTAKIIVCQICLRPLVKCHRFEAEAHIHPRPFYCLLLWDVMCTEEENRQSKWKKQQKIHILRFNMLFTLFNAIWETMNSYIYLYIYVTRKKFMHVYIHI